MPGPIEGAGIDNAKAAYVFQGIALETYAASFFCIIARKPTEVG